MNRRTCLATLAGSLLAGKVLAEPVKTLEEVKLLSYVPSTKANFGKDVVKEDPIWAETVFAKNPCTPQVIELATFTLIRMRQAVYLPKKYQMAFTGTSEEEKYTWYGEINLVRDTWVDFRDNKKFYKTFFYLCRTEKSTRGDLLR